MKVLDTHSGDPSGLGVVARHCASLGDIIKTGEGEHGKLLVGGRPDKYADLVTRNSLNYIWTTFESDLIPSDWVNAINGKFDEVYVPHEYIRKCFIASGVDVPIDVVEQGYQRYERTEPIKTSGPFIIGVLGVPVARKNIYALINAVKLLQDEMDIKLLIHCPWLVNQDQMEWSLYDFVELSVGHKTDDEIAEWYSQLNAYVYPSSGEGWSFTPREALYMGIPTIVSDIPVHDALLPYSTVIQVDEYVDAYYEFLDNTCGKWADISTENIMNSIRSVVTHYPDKLYQAYKASEWIKDKWRWKDCIKQIKNNIEPKHLLWCPTKYGKCGINTYSRALLPHLEDTKYVATFRDIQKEMSVSDIQSVHVQHEFGIFSTENLLNEINRIAARKKITMHTVIPNAGSDFDALIRSFDDVYVLNKQAANVIPKAIYAPHGTEKPRPKKNRVCYGTIGTFGFIHSQKGYKEITQATKDLNLRLRVVGDLDESNQRSMQLYNESIKDNPLVDHFNGYRDIEDSMQILSDCDLLVYYYDDSEVFYTSGAVLEAARLQNPIIVSNTKPFSDLIENECVYPVEPNNPSKLKEAIDTVLNDEGLKQTLINNMNNYLLEHLWSKIARNFQ